MLGDGKKMTTVTKEQQVARCIQMPNLSSSTSNLSHICTRNWYPSLLTWFDVYVYTAPRSNKNGFTMWAGFVIRQQSMWQSHIRRQLPPHTHAKPKLPHSMDERVYLLWVSHSPRWTTFRYRTYIECKLSSRSL